MWRFWGRATKKYVANLQTHSSQSAFWIMSMAQVMMCDFLKAVIVMLFGKMWICVNAYCGLNAVQIGLDFIWGVHLKVSQRFCRCVWAISSFRRTGHTVCEEKKESIPICMHCKCYSCLLEGHNWWKMCYAPDSVWPACVTDQVSGGVREAEEAKSRSSC